MKTKKKRIVPYRLAQLRQKNGWTQSKMAFEINENLDTHYRITPSTISTWETGRRPCPIKYAPIIARICLIDEAWLYAEDEGSNLASEGALMEVTADTLYKYDKKPLYVEFSAFQYSNGWCLYSKDTNKLVFTDRSITLYPKYLTSGAMRLYASQPIHGIQETDLLTKKCDIASVISADMVYVVVNSVDPIVRASYNGWYHHNTTRTALINAVGNILPYEGLGVSYSAYNATSTDSK